MPMNDKVTMTAFSGMLTKESPLRSVFASGIVPLSSPHSIEAELGEGSNRHYSRVFFVVLGACTKEQRDGIAQMMHQMGQGSLEEARKTVAIEETIPIRESNLSGVGFPLRYII